MYSRQNMRMMSIFYPLLDTDSEGKGRDAKVERKGQRRLALVDMQYGLIFIQASHRRCNHVQTSVLRGSKRLACQIVGIKMLKAK